MMSDSDANVCAGAKLDSPNTPCVDLEVPQAGANVTKGYVGQLDMKGIVPNTNPYHKSKMCPVNVHWHLGSEHYSVGEFDEKGNGPHGNVDLPEWANRARGLADAEVQDGFRCHHYDETDPKFTTPYEWKHCVGMEVGETYEVHWPHSAFGACGTVNQYQSPFYDGVFCNLSMEQFQAVTDPQVIASNVGVHGQVFTIVNDDSYFYSDMIRGMIIDADLGMGQDITYYTGSTTGQTRSNDMCSTYSPITWQVDRKCHMISASSFDKMCYDMKMQRDDMSDDLHAHGSRELVSHEIAANNHNFGNRKMSEEKALAVMSNPKSEHHRKMAAAVSTELALPSFLDLMAGSSMMSDSDANVCAGAKLDSPNTPCVDLEVPQAGANVTKGYVGQLDMKGIVPNTNPYHKSKMCPVNVHWHLGSEHYSVGEFDEKGNGPHGNVDLPEWANRARGLADAEVQDGFRCHHYDETDPKFTTPYEWKHCVGMEVGETYEVHWPHSAFGACGTVNQYQSPFYDGVFCNLSMEQFQAVTDPQVIASNVGVHGQVFTIVNDDSYFYSDMIRGMIIDADLGMGQDITYYTGSTTGQTRSNDMCSTYSPITWQVDRKCHMISASSFDKMCYDMKMQRDDMSDDLHAHGSRELVSHEIAANNHNFGNRMLAEGSALAVTPTGKNLRGR